MAIDETNLTKVQLRKLSALRKSVGDVLGDEVFIKWLARQAAQKAKVDPVAVKIVEALAGLEKDPNSYKRSMMVSNSLTALES